MPYTQADIDELRARIAQFAGVAETRFSDQATRFDMDGALKLLEQMEREVNAHRRTRYAAMRKGL